MNKEEALARLQEEDPDTLCTYCIYENDCDKGVTNAGGEPIFPPCCETELKNLIDIDAYIANVEEGGNE